MLRISRRADYAIRAMVAIAQTTAAEYTPTPDIGEEMRIPQSFLVKVIGDLRRGGLITTAVGRSGGVSLAQSPDDITLRDIVEAVEGPIALTGCLLHADACPRDETCPAHTFWAQIQGAFCAELEAVNLRMMARHAAEKAAANDSER
jgi:Rrf2 family protein